MYVHKVLVFCVSLTGAALSHSKSDVNTLGQCELDSISLGLACLVVMFIAGIIAQCYA